MALFRRASVWLRFRHGDHRLREVVIEVSRDHVMDVLLDRTLETKRAH